MGIIRRMLINMMGLRNSTLRNRVSTPRNEGIQTGKIDAIDLRTDRTVCGLG